MKCSTQWNFGGKNVQNETSVPMKILDMGKRLRDFRKNERPMATEELGPINVN